MSPFGNLITKLQHFVPKLPQVSTVRFRYHAELRAKPMIRRYGYKDKLALEGLLPHKSNGEIIPITTHK